MKIGFAGGTDAVGSLGMIVETGENRILFDYGLTPAKPPKYPRKVPPIDALFLTHSHLDHIGMSPYVCGEFGTTIWGSEVTLEVSVVLLQDSIKIAKLEGWSIPYDIHDVVWAISTRYQPEFDTYITPRVAGYGIDPSEVPTSARGIETGGTSSLTSRVVIDATVSFGRQMGEPVEAPAVTEEIKKRLGL